jgi:hypothetical protein
VIIYQLGIKCYLVNKYALFFFVSLFLLYLPLIISLFLDYIWFLGARYLSLLFQSLFFISSYLLFCILYYVSYLLLLSIIYIFSFQSLLLAIHCLVVIFVSGTYYLIFVFSFIIIIIY